MSVIINEPCLHPFARRMQQHKGKTPDEFANHPGATPEVNRVCAWVNSLDKPIELLAKLFPDGLIRARRLKCILLNFAVPINEMDPEITYKVTASISFSSAILYAIVSDEMEDIAIGILEKLFRSRMEHAGWEIPAENIFHSKRKTNLVVAKSLPFAINLHKMFEKGREKTIHMSWIPGTFPGIRLIIHNPNKKKEDGTYDEKFSSFINVFERRATATNNREYKNGISAMDFFVTKMAPKYKLTEKQEIKQKLAKEELKDGRKRKREVSYMEAEFIRGDTDHEEEDTDYEDDGGGIDEEEDSDGSDVDEEDEFEEY